MPRFSLKRAIALWLIVSAALLALTLSPSPYSGQYVVNMSMSICRPLDSRPLGIVEIQPSAGPTLYLHHRISTLRHRLSFINED
ncbi:hypothetical protein [Thermoleptolyngbya sp. M55_K2018_002]|uniref:hypothetical protein n=1 Tax=Thermoleptolyngbya sp. M55_K2018_002 TaxID=2747808 RepID=UPI0019E4B9EF|nr:hypothetical protein [Thermoleptolyngbya sp. M55_K2018_002]HIK41118.1 hypothetical protein [Thermoleptolyngbya sp. M55_K2018_002]